MKVTELPGIYWHMDVISPEAFKAQRMAELKDLAEFRARHLKAIQDWSDPVKRAEIQAKYKVDEAEGKKQFAEMFKDKEGPAAEEAYALIAVQKDVGPNFRLKMIEKVKASLVPKPTRFQKFVKWLRGIFEYPRSSC